MDNVNLKEKNELEAKIELEVEQAREVCDISGATSGACAAAWDAVEELQAESSHQRQQEPKKNSLQQYCDDNPEAAECRLYED